MTQPDPPPVWVPTLTEEIVLKHAAATSHAMPSRAEERYFPSELDEARLCMMVTDQLMSHLPDLIRSTVRDILLQQGADSAKHPTMPHDQPPIEG